MRALIVDNDARRTPGARVHAHRRGWTARRGLFQCPSSCRRGRCTSPSASVWTLHLRTLAHFAAS